MRCSVTGTTTMTSTSTRTLVLFLLPVRTLAHLPLCPIALHCSVQPSDLSRLRTPHPDVQEGAIRGEAFSFSFRSDHHALRRSTQHMLLQQCLARHHCCLNQHLTTTLCGTAHLLLAPITPATFSNHSVQHSIFPASTSTSPSHCARRMQALPLGEVAHVWTVDRHTHSPMVPLTD
jgi:hypothetical protein